MSTKSRTAKIVTRRNKGQQSQRLDLWLFRERPSSLGFVPLQEQQKWKKVRLLPTMVH
jgi:hypothetical protein